MPELKVEQTLTFEGKTFKEIPIIVKCQDGYGFSMKLLKDLDSGTLLVCNQNNEVLLKIIGEDFTVIPVD